MKPRISNIAQGAMQSTGPGAFRQPTDQSPPPPIGAVAPGGRGQALRPDVGGVFAGKPPLPMPLGGPAAANPTHADLGAQGGDDGDAWLAEFVQRVMDGRVNAQHLATVLSLLQQVSQPETVMGAPGAPPAPGIPGLS